MTNRYAFQVMASVALILIGTSLPLHAEGLGGLGRSIGGTLGGVGNAVGSTVNGATGKVGNTTTQLGALNKNGILSADVKSDILNGVMAKARILSPEALAKLCLAAGGNNKGCGSGNRPRILGLVDANLSILSDKRLISVCVSVGAGCGGSSSVASIGSNPVNGPIGDGNVPNTGMTLPSNTVPMPGNSVSNSKQQKVAELSDGELIAFKKRCVNVLGSPQKYEDDIVSICRLIKRQ